MEAVMINAPPTICEKVANRDCTLLVKKTRPKIDTPFKCYIYCTQSGDWLVSVNGKVNKPNSADIDLTVDTIVHELNGKVIGEFVCDKIENIFAQSRFWLNEDTLKSTCLSAEQIWDYANGAEKIYGWHISNLMMYDKPKDLSEFFTPIGKRPSYMLERPFQSWGYVEENN